MTSKTNKRKRSVSKLASVPAEPPLPIVFLARGVKADTRLQVFKQDFFLHSSGLKHHSNYFCKFLDSIDKQPPPIPAEFKYEYRSVIDEDGSWALMPVAETEEVTDDLIALVDDPEEEIESFRKLLCAIHSKGYTIQNTEQLTRLTRLADYYCALPVISGTLTGAIFKSPLFGKRVKEGELYCESKSEAGSLLLLARKLRHKLLFKESLIHTVTGWDSGLLLPVKHAIEQDKQLHNLVLLKLGTLHAAIAKAQQNLLRAMFNGYFLFDTDYIGTAATMALDLDVTESVRFFAQKYRDLISVDTSDLDSVEDSISPLLKNNLVLDWTSHGPGKNGLYATSFLCTDVQDCEYPWPLEDIDR